MNILTPPQIKLLIGLLEDIYIPFATVNVNNPEDLAKAKAHYICQLGLIVESQGPEVAAQVHANIVFYNKCKNPAKILGSLFYLLAALYMLQVDMVPVRTDGFVAEFFAKVAEFCFKGVAILMIAMVGIANYEDDRDLVNRISNVIQHLALNNQTIQELIWLPELEELFARERALLALENSENPRALYALGSISQRVTMLCDQLIKSDTTNQSARWQNLKTSHLQKAASNLTAVLSKDLTLGMLCTFEPDILSIYIGRAISSPPIEPRIGKIYQTLKQRKIFQNYRNGMPDAVEQTLNILRSIVTNHDNTQNHEECIKFSANELFARIVGLKHDALDMQEIEAISSDSINFNGLMFNPLTTSVGQTYDKSALMEWFAAGGNLDPMTGEQIIANSIANLEFIQVMDYLALGGKIREYPGFINPETNKRYVQPVLKFSGHTIDKKSCITNNAAENVIFRQLGEKFSPSM